MTNIFILQRIRTKPIGIYLLLIIYGILFNPNCWPRSNLLQVLRQVAKITYRINMKVYVHDGHFPHNSTTILHGRPHSGGTKIRRHAQYSTWTIHHSLSQTKFRGTKNTKQQHEACRIAETAVSTREITKRRPNPPSQQPYWYVLISEMRVADQFVLDETSTPYSPYYPRSAGDSLVGCAQKSRVWQSRTASSLSE